MAIAILAWNTDPGNPLRAKYALRLEIVKRNAYEGLKSHIARVTVIFANN